MKIFYTLISLIVSLSLSAQRFDWVSFTPLTTGNANGGSGTLSVTNDDEGNIYTVCVFHDPIVAGDDTVHHAGNFGRPDILLTKWNADGQVLAYRHIANYSNNGNPDPQNVIFDEVNGEILLNIMSYYSGMQITLKANDTEADLPLTLTAGAVLRFSTDLDFIANNTIPGGTGYTTPAVTKDGYLYAAQGYSSTVSKTDASGAVLWTVDPNTSFYIQDIAISNQDTIYVIGYSQYGGTVGLGGVNATAPSTGNFSHAMIFKLDAEGTVHQGIHFLDAAYYTFPLRLTTDAEGNVFVAASYQVTGQMIGDHALSNPTGVRDGLVTKFTSDLQPLWTTELHHTGGDFRTTDILVNSSGRVMVTGSYGGVATLGAFSLNSSFYGSCFLAQLDNENGNVHYATQFGAFIGTAVPYSVSNVDDKYYIGGLSYGSGQNGASYGCYTHTYTCAYLTVFNDIPFETPTVELVYGSVSLLASTNVGDATFQWFLNGEEIEGETGSSIVPSLAGNYEVVVSYFGCTASDTYDLSCLPTTGTDIISACNSYTWIDGVTYTSNNSSATHLLTSSLGCDSLVTLNLTIEPIDNSVTVNGNTITANQSGADYQWVDCDTKFTHLENETSQSFTPAQSGSYAVQVTLGNCNSMSECIDIQEIAVMETKQLSTIDIYPNPANDFITISAIPNNSVITIFDMTGQIVYTSKTNNPKAIINTSDYVSGMYQLQIGNHSSFESRKFVVSK